MTVRAPLCMILPTRSRPGNLWKVALAWSQTTQYDEARLHVVLDADDPHLDGYRLVRDRIHAKLEDVDIEYVTNAERLMLVPKLNRAAVALAAKPNGPTILGFMGDDHLPRTEGWGWQVRMALEPAVVAPSIAYPNDLFQGRRLPTAWMMHTDIVRALGAMVPAPVDHLYCDNAILQLGLELRRITYLQTIVFEHMHPLAHKAPSDAQYERVNSTEQYSADRARYAAWVESDGPTEAARLVRGYAGERA